MCTSKIYFWSMYICILEVYILQKYMSCTSAYTMEVYFGSNSETWLWLTTLSHGLLLFAKLRHLVWFSSVQRRMLATPGHGGRTHPWCPADRLVPSGWWPWSLGRTSPWRLLLDARPGRGRVCRSQRGSTLPSNWFSGKVYVDPSMKSGHNVWRFGTFVEGVSQCTWIVIDNMMPSTVTVLCIIKCFRAFRND